MEYFLMIIWLCLVGINFVEGDVDLATNYQIHEIEHNPGLYYKKIDQVRIINKEWKLLISLDVRSFLDLQPPSLKTIDKHYQECIKILEPKACSEELRREIIKDLSREVEGIRDHLNNILTETAIKRKSRAPLLGFVGTIARKIFGTMDYNDHEHLTKEIDRLYQDQRQITHLIGNSTHVIQTEINNLRKINEKNFQNVKILESQVTSLISGNIQMNNQIRGMDYLNYLGRIGQKVEHAASKYLDILHKTAQAIEDAKHGKLNPILINNEQILTASREIEKSTPDSIFPITKQKLDLSIISQISKIETGINKGRFLVTVKIPLLPREYFELFRMLPCRVPQIIQGNRKVTAYIKPKSEYIMTSKSRAYYALISKEYLQSCIPLENCLACSRGIPIKKPVRNLECEYNLLNNNDLKPTSELLRNCDIRMMMDLETSWTELSAEEGWLFSTVEAERMEINCNGQLADAITLQGTGILRLNSNCTAETSSILLEGTGTISSELPVIHGIPLTINISEIAPILQKSPSPPNLLTKLEHNVLPNYTFIDPFGKSMQETIQKAEEIGLHHQEDYQHRLFSLTNCSITGVLTTIMGVMIFFSVKKGFNPCSILKYCSKKKVIKENKFSRRVPIQKSQIERDYEVPVSTISLVPVRPGPPMPVVTRIDERNLCEMTVMPHNKNSTPEVETSGLRFGYSLTKN